MYDAREPLLESHLVHDVHLVEISDHQLTLRLTEKVPGDFTQRLGKILSHKTGSIWKIDISNEMGQPTLHELRQIAKEKRIEDSKSLEIVAHALKLFPEAVIENVTEMEN